MSEQTKGHGEAFISPFWDRAISGFWLAVVACLLAGLLSNFFMTGSLLREEEKMEKFGYPIEAAAEDTGAPSEGTGGGQRPDIFPMIVAAKAEDGQKVFTKCAACHTAEAGGANKVGPNLHNIVGDDVGDRNGFKTTDSLKAIGGKWDYNKLDQWVENPRQLAAKTTMSFAGLKKPEDRASVIKYLMSQTDSPPPVPASNPAIAAPAEAPKK